MGLEDRARRRCTSMKKEFQIEYINGSGVPMTSKIFACDEADVRKIFQKIYGDQCRVESVFKHEIKQAPLMQLEYE
jgi:hypothetical protein